MKKTDRIEKSLPVLLLWINRHNQFTGYLHATELTTDKGPRRSGSEAEGRKRHLRGTIFLAAQEAFEVNIHGDTLSSLHRCKIHAKSRKDQI